MGCRNVLVVEDDLDIRESLEQILEFEGYSPILAENGGRAALPDSAGFDDACDERLGVFRSSEGKLNSLEYSRRHRLSGRQ